MEVYGTGIRYDVGMCESHVNDAVRRAFAIKKVASSRSKGETTVVTEQKLDEDARGTLSPLPVMK